MIVLQAKVHLKKEDLEEFENKIMEKTGENYIVIPYHMAALDLKYEPWKEKQIKDYIEQVNNPEDKKKRKPFWWIW